MTFVDTQSSSYSKSKKEKSLIHVHAISSTRDSNILLLPSPRHRFNLAMCVGLEYIVAFVCYYDKHAQCFSRPLLVARFLIHARLQM